MAARLVRLNPEPDFSSSAVTAASGFTVNVNDVRRCGRVVTLNLMISGFTEGSYAKETLCATVPAGFRPSNTVRGPVGHTSKVTAASSEYFVLSADGRLYVSTTSGIVLVNAAYIA